MDLEESVQAGRRNRCWKPKMVDKDLPEARGHLIYLYEIVNQTGPSQNRASDSLTVAVRLRSLPSEPRA
jgi:hypothetical protein